ncbi:PQQ-dependent sugar dehydrogenase [Caldilinea aerophila]|uniref:PQQ-dependent sugar dehydrogenase n=1 Tax=Caldilinea aerophila TaxID=133453 RepID=UPI0002D60991|nr:PQQ-dependent sugar dehydrogenase [Caldilinea aerophila]
MLSTVRKRLYPGARVASLALLLISILLPPAAQPVWAQGGFNLPDGFIQEEVVAGLKLPTSFALAPDGRIFITEKAGRVRVFHRGELLSEPFIDITGEVNDYASRGLMGIAVDPAWPRRPYVYLAFVYDPPEIKDRNPSGARVSRVIRLTADSKDLNKALPDSGVVLVGKNSIARYVGNPDQGDAEPFSCLDENKQHVRDCIATEGDAHTVNMVTFGPDGALYVAVGDGIVNSKGNPRALDINSLNGKILRVDPDTGKGLRSNPFFDGDPDSNRSKVFALGLRNPFRITVDPRNGRVIIGEVGNQKWEEINIAEPGANFGWPCYEGPEEAASYADCRPYRSGELTVVAPTFAYTHTAQPARGAAIGGDLYLGRTFPAIYRGAYFYHDYNGGVTNFLTFNADGSVTDHEFATNMPGIVQMTATNDSLYALSIVLGGLYRIRYTGASARPVATTATPRATMRATPAQGGGADAATAAPTPQPARSSGTAADKRIRAEVWKDVSGSDIDAFLKTPQFRNQPPTIVELDRLAFPRGSGVNYGVRIRGYLVPPATGDYRFFISADDRGALSLSKDANPANKVVIAYTPDWTNAEVYDKFPEQASGPITLKGGQRYYFEVIYKQGDGKDNLFVAWERPGGGIEVITADYVEPFHE